LAGKSAVLRFFGYSADILFLDLQMGKPINFCSHLVGLIAVTWLILPRRQVELQQRRHKEAKGKQSDIPYSNLLAFYSTFFFIFTLWACWLRRKKRYGLKLFLN